MRYLIAVVAAGLAALVPVAAQAQVKLVAGEEVTATAEARGGGIVLEVTGRSPATPNAFETWAAAAYARGEMDGAGGPNARPIYSEEAPAPVPVAGRVRLRFTPTEAGDSLLVIENGLDRGMVYRATMHRGAQSRPTDVCLVPPGKVAIEHWPHPLDAITVDNIRLVAWQPEDGLPCE